MRCVDAGFRSKAPPTRVGRREKDPPQFGQRPPRTDSTHLVQNVHSNEQIQASVESGARSTLQHSHPGRICSMSDSCRGDEARLSRAIARMRSNAIACVRDRTPRAVRRIRIRLGTGAGIDVPDQSLRPVRAPPRRPHAAAASFAPGSTPHAATPGRPCRSRTAARLMLDVLWGQRRASLRNWGGALSCRVVRIRKGWRCSSHWSGGATRLGKRP